MDFVIAKGYRVVYEKESKSNFCLADNQDIEQRKAQIEIEQLTRQQEARIKLQSLNLGYLFEVNKSCNLEADGHEHRNNDDLELMSQDSEESQLSLTESYHEHGL